MLTLLSKGGGVAVFSICGGLRHFCFSGLVSQNCSMLNLPPPPPSQQAQMLMQKAVEGDVLPSLGQVPCLLLVYFWREKGFVDRTDLIPGRFFLPAFQRHQKKGSLLSAGIPAEHHVAVPRVQPPLETEVHLWCGGSPAT